MPPPPPTILIVTRYPLQLRARQRCCSTAAASWARPFLRRLAAPCSSAAPARARAARAHAHRRRHAQEGTCCLRHAVALQLTASRSLAWPRASTGRTRPWQTGPITTTGAACPRLRLPSSPITSSRCFVGNLGNEVDDNSLIRAFQSYPSFQRAKVIFDKRLRKTRGYGFVSFKNAECFSKALREMQARDSAAAPLTIHSSTTRLSSSARATHSRRALLLICARNALTPRAPGKVHRQPAHHHPQERVSGEEPGRRCEKAPRLSYFFKKCHKCLILHRRPCARVRVRAASANKSYAAESQICTQLMFAARINAQAIHRAMRRVIPRAPRRSLSFDF